MSANRTETRLSSPLPVGRGTAGRCSEIRALPHLEQNRSPTSLLRPQDAQATPSGVPQLVQNRVSFLLSASQFGQRTTAPGIRPALRRYATVTCTGVARSIYLDPIK